MPAETAEWQQKIGGNTYAISAQRIDDRIYLLYKKPEEIGWHTLAMEKLDKKTCAEIFLKAREQLKKNADEDTE